MPSLEYFLVQYLSFVSLRSKSLTFLKFFVARRSDFAVVVILASAAVFVRAKLGTKISFSENKYWKVGEFIDISEFVLIYLRFDFVFWGWNMLETVFVIRFFLFCWMKLFLINFGFFTARNVLLHHLTIHSSTWRRQKFIRVQEKWA